MRGYGAGAARAARRRRPWSRHDLAFAASAVALAALAVGARVAGVAGFDGLPAPRRAARRRAGSLLAAALAAVALPPFADRRGIER